MESLEQYLIPEDVERDTFIIVCADTAMWAMRKITQAKAKAEANRKLAQAEITKITLWLEKVNKKEEETIAFMEGHILSYYETLREADHEFRTLDLPTGKVRRRLMPQDYECDEVQLIAWAEKHAQDVVRVEKAVAWGDLKKRLSPIGTQAVDKLTGEIIPGIKPLKREEKVWVEA